DGIDNLIEGDQRAGALGELDGLPAPDKADQLSNQDLNIELRVITGAGGERLEAVDVPVMVGAEHVDALVEAALALVDVVRGVGSQVRLLAVAPDEDAILIVGEVGG